MKISNNIHCKTYTEDTLSQKYGNILSEDQIELNLVHILKPLRAPQIWFKSIPPPYGIDK